MSVTVWAMWLPVFLTMNVCLVEFVYCVEKKREREREKSYKVSLIVAAKDVPQTGSTLAYVSVEIHAVEMQWEEQALCRLFLHSAIKTCFGQVPHPEFVTERAEMKIFILLFGGERNNSIVVAFNLTLFKYIVFLSRNS